jgi:hypothetical protein
LRLVMAGGTRNVWAWLEPETHEEALALQTCVARGEWTNGHGAEAIARLRALAARLGCPVRDANRQTTPPPPCLVIVRRGERDLFERLTAIARESVTVVWDRRLGERRTTDRPAAVDRRRQDRRQLTPQLWITHGFLVVQFGEASP